MTALAQYQRLEAIGLWQPAGGAGPREVVVSFGQATLVFSDPGTEVPLTHWSLPAVTNLTPGRHPAVYAPAPPGKGEAPAETLTIDEPAMIDALARVHHAIDAALPHPGRLRKRLSLGIAALAVAAGVWWLPGWIVHHTVRIAPPAQRAVVGEAVLADLTRLTGPVCHRPAGDTVLARLADRLAPAMGRDGAGSSDRDTRLRLHVLPGGIRGAVPLPGGIVLLGPDLLGLEAEPFATATPEPGADPDADSGPEPDWGALTSTRPQPRPPHRAAPAVVHTDPGPDILAGAILAALQGAAEADPLAPILTHAGAWPSLSLLVRGHLDAAAVQGYGRDLMATPSQPPQDSAALLARFAAISLPSTPYARQRDPAAPLTLALIEGDPVRGQPFPRGILSDSEWEALREICQRP